MPEQIWISDTTFRDGRQSHEPYAVEQIGAFIPGCFTSCRGGQMGVSGKAGFYIQKDQEADSLQILANGLLKVSR